MATNGGLWASLGRVLRGQYHSATPAATKASAWVEDDGLAYIDTSAWMGTNAHGDLMRNDRGYAEAYMSVEWAFRAINVRTVMIADVLRDAHLIDNATGKEAEPDIIERAFDLSYRLFGGDVYADWCFNKAVYGETYVEIVRNDWGIAQTVRVLNSVAVEPVIARGEVTGYVYEGDAGTVHFSKADIVFDRQRHAVDDTRGYSLLAAALNAVNIDRQLVLVTHRHLKNNMRPGLIFTPGENNLTEQNADFLKRTLREQASGSQNTGKPLFLPIPMTVTTAEPPKFEDQQTLGETQKRKICSAVGVPVALVDYADMAYQLSPEQRRTLYDLTVRPEARNIARVIDVHIRPRLDMAGRYRFEVNNDKLDFRLAEPRDLADLAKSRYEAGLVTLNDARMAQGLEAVDGGDVYLMPTGRIAVPAGQLNQLPSLLSQANEPAPTPLAAVDTIAATPVQAAGPTPMATVTGTTPVTLPAKADTPPAPPQSDAVDEVRAFVKAVTNNRPRAVSRFEFYHAPGELAAVLRTEAEEADNLKAWGAEMLTLAIKGEVDYARALRALVRGLWRGVVSEFDFVDGFYTAIRREYRKAFEAGVEDGGDTFDNLSDKQKQRLEVLINGELAHVPAFKDAIVEADQAKGGNLDPLISRVPSWVSRLSGIRAVGKLVALGDKRQKWVYQEGKEHCQDCRNLNGRIYKASTWERWNIYPQSARLECYGTYCGCGFEDTDEPITRGRPPRLHGKAMKAIAADEIPDADAPEDAPDVAHDHEHTHEEGD